MRTLLCIGAVFVLCGQTHAQQTSFDPFAGIVDGVAQGLASGLYAIDSPYAQTDGNVVIGSPVSPDMNIGDDLPDMTDDWIQRPDMMDSIMGLAEESGPTLILQGSSKADDAQEAAQGVNLVSPADAD